MHSSFFWDDLIIYVGNNFTGASLHTLTITKWRWEYMSFKVTGHEAIVFPDSLYCKHGNIYFIMSEAIVFRQVRMLKLPLEFQKVIYKYKNGMLNVFALFIRYIFNIVIPKWMPYLSTLWCIIISNIFSKDINAICRQTCLENQ